MTAVELIEKLKELPPDYEILISGNFGLCCPLEVVKIDISDAMEQIEVERNI